MHLLAVISLNETNRRSLQAEGNESLFVLWLVACPPLPPPWERFKNRLWPSIDCRGTTRTTTTRTTHNVKRWELCSFGPFSGFTHPFFRRRRRRVRHESSLLAATFFTVRRVAHFSLYLHCFSFLPSALFLFSTFSKKKEKNVSTFNRLVKT